MRRLLWVVTVLGVSTLCACSLLFDVDKLGAHPEHEIEDEGGARDDSGVDGPGGPDGGLDGDTGALVDARPCPNHLPEGGGFCDDFDDDAPLTLRWGNQDGHVPTKKDGILVAVEGSQYCSKKLDELSFGAKLSFAFRVRLVDAPDASDNLNINPIRIFLGSVVARVQVFSNGDVQVLVIDTGVADSAKATKIAKGYLADHAWKRVVLDVEPSANTWRFTAKLENDNDPRQVELTNRDAGAKAYSFYFGSTDPVTGAPWEIQLDDLFVTPAP